MVRWGRFGPMMQPMEKIWHILAFDSTHAAMAAQRLLAHLGPFVIPTPKEITASCGISLRMDPPSAAQAKEVLADHADIAQRSTWHVLVDGKRQDGHGQPRVPAQGQAEDGTQDTAQDEAAPQDRADAAPRAPWFPVTGDPASDSTLIAVPVTLYHACADPEEGEDQDPCLQPAEEVDEDVQVEHTLDVYVNEILTMRVVCTPDHLVDLVVGRLFTEGLISGPGEIESLELLGGSTRANVYLRNRQADLSRALVHTVPTCCTGNQVFNSYFEGDETLRPLAPMDWDPEWIFSLARQFAADTPMHRKTSGTHSCYLAVRDRVLYCCEDLGRHNAFDKVIGCALQDGVDLTSAIVFTSGRLPVDMVLKGIRSGIPVLVSKAVPTDMTIKLAQEFGLTLICSARPDSMKVFNDQLCKPQGRK